MDIENIWVTPDKYSVKLRHIGVLDLDMFYDWLNRWFEFEGYSNLEKNEKRYHEDIFPDGKKNIRIIWQCSRNKTQYFKYVIDVAFLIVGVQKTEVMKDGKKIELHKLDLELLLGAHVEKSAPQGFLKRIYDRFIIRRRIDAHKQDLKEKFETLSSDIKKFFGQWVM